MPLPAGGNAARPAAVVTGANAKSTEPETVAPSASSKTPFSSTERPSSVVIVTPSAFSKVVIVTESNTRRIDAEPASTGTSRTTVARSTAATVT